MVIVEISDLYKAQSSATVPATLEGITEKNNRYQTEKHFLQFTGKQFDQDTATETDDYVYDVFLAVEEGSLKSFKKRLKIASDAPEMQKQLLLAAKSLVEAMPKDECRDYEAKLAYIEKKLAGTKEDGLAAKPIDRVPSDELAELKEVLVERNEELKAETDDEVSPIMINLVKAIVVTSAVIGVAESIQLPVAEAAKMTDAQYNRVRAIDVAFEDGLLAGVEHHLTGHFVGAKNADVIRAVSKADSLGGAVVGGIVTSIRSDAYRSCLETLDQCRGFLGCTVHFITCALLQP